MRFREQLQLIVLQAIVMSKINQVMLLKLIKSKDKSKKLSESIISFNNASIFFLYGKVKDRGN